MILGKGFEMESPAIVAPDQMDFMDALRLVINGKKITRLDWDDPAIYVALRGGFLCIVQNGTIDRLLVSDGDLYAVDWVALENNPIHIN